MSIKTKRTKRRLTLNPLYPEKTQQQQKVIIVVSLNFCVSLTSPVEKSKAKKKEEKAKAEKADDPKAGADVGKIVNLMANDANRVRVTLFSTPQKMNKIWIRLPIWFRELISSTEV